MVLLNRLHQINRPQFDIKLFMKTRWEMGRKGDLQIQTVPYNYEERYNLVKFRNKMIILCFLSWKSLHFNVFLDRTQVNRGC